MQSYESALHALVDTGSQKIAIMAESHAIILLLSQEYDAHSVFNICEYATRSVANGS